MPGGPVISNLYYAMSLAAFLAALWFAGRKERRETLDKATATLLSTYQQTITAQAERIALLERDKKDMTVQLEKQGSRIEYLEELLIGGGHSQVVAPGSVPPVQGAGRGRGAAHSAPGGNG